MGRSQPPSLRDRPSGRGGRRKCAARRGDAGYRRYLSPATPPGSGPDRYFLVVQAVAVEELEVTAATPPALMDFFLFTHAIARAIMYATYER
ncbi:hypothetical protein ACWEQN_34090 [Streptomyces sp. NPDC004129]|uniref:hypothetical protein n=1 Tax=Streptomyces sp. NPDC004533 TaxID=3154278 RepID=UPI00339E9339